MAEWSLETVAKLAIIGVATILFLIIAVNFAVFAEDKTDEEKCLYSLTIMDASREFSKWSHIPGQGNRADPIINVTCPIKVVEIDLPDDNIKDELRREIAELIRICWHKTGAGALEPFGRMGKNYDFSIYRSQDDNCILCNRFTFSDKVKNHKDKAGDFDLLEITNIYPYLAKQKLIGQDKTYLEYFSYQPTQTVIHPLDEDQFNTINTSKTYYLIWRYRVAGAINLLLEAPTQRNRIDLLLLPVKDFKEASCENIYT